MNNILHSYKKIAFVFFAVIGFVHITASLLVSNGFFADASNIVSKIFDIPFAILTLIYTLLSIEISPESKHKKLIFISFLVIVLAVFSLLLYVTAFIPDRIINQ